MSLGWKALLGYFEMSRNLYWPLRPQGCNGVAIYVVMSRSLPITISSGHEEASWETSLPSPVDEQHSL